MCTTLLISDDPIKTLLPIILTVMIMPRVSLIVSRALPHKYLRAAASTLVKTPFLGSNLNMWESSKIRLEWVFMKTMLKHEQWNPENNNK